MLEKRNLELQSKETNMDNFLFPMQWNFPVQLMQDCSRHSFCTLSACFSVCEHCPAHPTRKRLCKWMDGHFYKSNKGKSYI